MRSSKRTRIFLGGLLGLVSLAYGADRLEFPGDFPGPPFYSYEFNSPNDGWAAVFFIRDPDCVPATADLLAIDFASLSCELTVHGYAIRSNPLPAPPDVFHAEGEGDMPVWLLSSKDIASAVADGVLNIGELASAPSLRKGTARRFVVHEEVPNGLTQILSHGELEDGRKFRAKLSIANGELKGRHIEVR